jgi:sugar phosphate isomerase/epimerase
MSSKKMTQIKGPAIFLAQFMSDNEPFNNFENAVKAMASFGYKGVQVHSNDPRAMDLKLAAESKSYCEDLQAVAAKYGVEITELSTHIQGQLLCTHPAYDEMYDGFCPPEVRGNVKARTEWAHQQMLWAAKASANLGHKAQVTFSGAFAWPYFYSWPPRPAGLIDEAFKELAKRWRPILDAFDDASVDLCYEIHPGEDLHDGLTFERFLALVDNHPRANILYDPSHFILQQLDYLDFIDIYHDRIKMFHVKDAEFNPNGRGGVYGGYADWAGRPGRFRSPGDGQIDFGAIFSKLTQYGYEGWAVVEWECAIKDNIQGARESAVFVENHIIKPTAFAFDDFASAGTDASANKRIMGIDVS